jgi:hypothetical protein
MIFLGANRLRIDENTKDLKAKVDVSVETYIAAHHQDKKRETRINRVRAEWFEAIDNCEQFNLTELEKREDKNLKLEDEQLFKRFIFEFKVADEKELINLRLIAIDKYITPGKVECFQILMTLIDKDIEIEDLQDNLLEKLFANIDLGISNL